MTVINPQFDLAIGDVDSYRKSLLAEADELLTRSDTGLDAAGNAEFEALTAEIQRVDADQANRQTIRNAAGYEGPSFDPPGLNIGRQTATSGRAVPTEADHRRDDAMRAVDSCRSLPGWTAEAAEAAERLVEQERAAEGAPYADQSAASQVIRATANPAYVSAWRRLMRDPVNAHRTWSNAELEAFRTAQDFTQARAMNEVRTAMSEGSTGVGGALVPYFLDPTINLTNAGVVSPIRDLATVKQITTNIWHGVTSQGVTAEWIGEATEVSDASPSFLQPTITTYKADAYVQASMELIADAALSGEIAGLLADAKGRLEGTAFAVGTGTAQPRGIITACSGGANLIAGSSGAAGSADLVAADIFAVANALPARYRANGKASWLASFTVLNKIRQLANAQTTNSSAFWTDLNGPNPPKLIGFGIHEVSDMDSTIVSGSNDDILLFGDISQFYVVDRIGMEMVFNPLVLGSNRRPTGESGWVAFWRQGADCVNSGAARLLRV